jgi:hypothetical protein
MELALIEKLGKENLETLREANAFLHGPFLAIWQDRPWHWQTKQEIKILQLAAIRLGYWLPRFVLERVALWLQLVDLVRDFRAGTLKLFINVHPLKESAALDKIAHSTCKRPWQIEFEYDLPEDRETQLLNRYEHWLDNLKKSNNLVYLPQVCDPTPPYWDGNVHRWQVRRGLKDLKKPLQDFVDQCNNYRIPVDRKLIEHIAYSKTISLDHDPFIEC